MKNRSTFLGAVILLLIILGTVYSIFIRPSFYRFNGGEVYLYPTQHLRFDEDHINLTVMDSYIYECNKNGLTKKSLDGEMVWSKSFYIEDPLLVTRGKYLAVADLTGKSTYVFNEEGFIREVKESYPIIDVHINEEGFLTSVQEKGKQNIIHYYDNKGNLPIVRATRFFEDGYPIDVATSDDVQKMMTGYLNVSNNRLQTHVSFFGFDAQYDSYNENIIGGFVYEDALVSRVDWLTQDMAAAVMDNQVVIYDCKEEPEIVGTIPLNAELAGIGYCDDYLVMQFGKTLSENNEQRANGVSLYSHDGTFVDDFVYEEPFT